MDAWLEVENSYVPGYHTNSIAWTEHRVVCNMPQEFRHSFYTDHALVGFGAAFHRHAPKRAFNLFEDQAGIYRHGIYVGDPHPDFWKRTCDIVFTGLTPRVLVDIPKQCLPWENDDNRMWKQPEHQAERARMLDLVKQVRDGA